MSTSDESSEGSLEPETARASQEREDSSGSSTEARVIDLSRRAGTLGEEGRYEEAIQLATEAIDLVGAEVPQWTTPLGMLLSLVAAFHHSLGDFGQAASYYEQALVVLRAPEASASALAAALWGLGVLHLETHDFTVARDLLVSAWEIYRESDSEDADGVLNALGRLNFQLGDFDGAKSFYDQALALRERKLGRDHPKVAETLNNLAVLHQAKGDYGEAFLLYGRALDTWRREGEPWPLEAIPVVNNKAMFAKSVGDDESAEFLLRQALDVLERAFPGPHPHTASTLTNLADVCVASKGVDEAFDLYLRSAEMDDDLLAQVFSIGSESHRLAYLEKVLESLFGFLSLVLGYRKDRPEAVRAALDLVLRRKGIAAEVLAAQRDMIFRGSHPELAPALEELAAKRMQIAQKTLAGPGREGPEEHVRTLDRWIAEREELERRLASAIPEIGLDERLRRSDRRAVAAALPEGSALVEFIRFDEFDFFAVPAQGEAQWKPSRYLAFVLRTREPDEVALVDLGEAAAIDALVASYRSVIAPDAEARGADLAVDASEAGSPDVGNEVYEKVFHPLLGHLGDRLRLFLAPDGDLTRLPFEVIPNDGGGRLIDRYTISYVSTGRDLLRFAPGWAGDVGRRRIMDPLVAADPDFSLTSLGRAEGGSDGTPFVLGSAPGRRSVDLRGGEVSFPRLPGTRREGTDVASALRVAPVMGSDVLEGRLKASQSPWILHLASHGFFLADQAMRLRPQGLLGDDQGSRAMAAENPLLRSGIALAGAQAFIDGEVLPEEAEDGILTAEDVSGLDLLGTELVVLSACDTGLGEVRRGEGVFGLRRAFVLAGAKTLVMSLWKVPDDATRELMAGFYERLLAGERRAEALRHAQLHLAKTYPHPWFWGAFICQGDPGPLRTSGADR